MNNSKTLNSGPIGALDTNLYNSKINLKNLKIHSREFDLMGISYYTANYMADRTNKQFTCAIVPKNTMKATLYQAEIERQNNLKIEIFCKPIMYFYDTKFIYILYPYLKQRQVYAEKSPMVIYKTIKELQTMYKQLHDKQLCFRTLCTNNIFYEDNTNNIKLLRSVNLIDNYELTASVDKKFNRNNMYKILEPQEFNPPEIFERGWCDYKADIWGQGILMFKLCNGTMPFNHKNYDFNLQLKSNQMESFGRYVPINLQNLIRRMLEFNPFKRINIDQILQNEWICQQSEESSLLDKELQDRIKNRQNTSNSSWWRSSISVFKSVIPESFNTQNLENVGNFVGRSVRSVSNYTKRNISAPIMKACQKTFQCYNDDDFQDADTKRQVEINRERLKEKLKKQERNKAKERREVVKSVINGSQSEQQGSDPSRRSLVKLASTNRNYRDSSEVLTNVKSQHNIVSSLPR